MTPFDGVRSEIVLGATSPPAMVNSVTLKCYLLLHTFTGLFFFFFKDPAPTKISPFPLHDALPIYSLEISAVAAAAILRIRGLPAFGLDFRENAFQHGPGGRLGQRINERNGHKKAQKHKGWKQNGNIFVSSVPFCGHSLLLGSTLT